MREDVDRTPGKLSAAQVAGSFAYPGKGGLSDRTGIVCLSRAPKTGVFEIVRSKSVEKGLVKGKDETVRGWPGLGHNR